ncbi:beta-ketoacyl synthase [Nocardia coubleae]|uniref:beta-ketoacyl synthase n=1 Tax=Nocardia coubleae TaxID=356147 RepID=UPI0009FBD882|nr:beta-ketoacyl synthase [Nocardia coubleae]
MEFARQTRDGAQSAGERATHAGAPAIAETSEGSAAAPRAAIAQLRTGVVTAHRAALAAQVALQRALWTRAVGTPLLSNSVGVRATDSIAVRGQQRAADSAVVPAGEGTSFALHGVPGGAADDARISTAVLGGHQARTFGAAVESPANGEVSAGETTERLGTGIAAPIAGTQRSVAGPGVAVPGHRGTAPVGVTAPVGDRASRASVVAREGAFKPLARTTRTELDRAALESLTAGAIAEVFGPAYRRDGVEVAACLAGGEPLALNAVEAIELYGGTGDGRVVARYDGAPDAAARQAAEVFALFTGMHLCLSGSTLTAATESLRAPSSPARPVGQRYSTGSAVAGRVAAHRTLELIVSALDLVSRPHVTGTVSFSTGEPGLSVEVTVTEAPGAGVGPGEAVPSLLLNEFHMTHLARGDQAIAMGPEFAEYTGVRATRLPTGGLLLVDRVREFDGARGTLDHATYTTEYDSPADSWYYADTANESMPHFVYMETSLQAALLMGYYAGPTLTQPGTTLSLRNLGGTATFLRQVDLRDRTIEQSSRLLSTTILPGSSLQTFDYTLSVDGEPFYTGETMFGYFSDEALANQTGLDAGRPAPSWLAENPTAEVRTIDVAGRRADPTAPLCSRRTLALIDQVDVVDGGGKHGAGYLHSLRPIDPADWFFARHFHLDPVIPGSLGVESVIHAVQEWLLDAGHAADMADPVFRIPADIPFSWRYRGQFLPTDGTVELEAHVKALHRGPHGVTAVVDGSLWKPGLRIYEVTDLAVELVDRRA